MQSYVSRFSGRLARPFAITSLALLSGTGCASDSKGGGEAGGGGQSQGGNAGSTAGGGTDNGGAAGDAGSSSGRGGTAGTGGTAGGGGITGDPSAPECDPSASTLGRIELPNPLISKGLEVTASSSVRTPALLVDGLYTNVAPFGVPTADAPSWVALPVSGPTRLLLVWADGGVSSPYNVTAGAAADYRIETSADSTDGEDGTWDIAVSVEDNGVHARGHSFDFEGKSWVRFVATRVPEGASSVALSEIALYDISASGAERPQDTWAFLGDSITQGAFGRNLGAAAGFDAQIQAAHADFTPAMINGGIGGEFARDGAQRIAEFLELNPDFHYVAIGYGTNDSWGDAQPTRHAFEASLRIIVEAVLEDGRVPVLARIPFASVAHGTLPAFNEVIDRLSREYELPCGPDLYGWFRDNQQDLSADGVHPARNGYIAMSRLWAETAASFYVEP